MLHGQSAQICVTNDQTVLSATHIQTIPACKASLPFGWYSLRLPTKEWPGWVDLGGWSHTEINFPHRKLNLDMVTHPSTNRARCRLISVLPLCQTPPRHTSEITCTVMRCLMGSWCLNTFSDDLQVSLIKYHQQDYNSSHDTCKHWEAVVIHLLTAAEVQLPQSLQCWHRHALKCSYNNQVGRTTISPCQKTTSFTIQQTAQLKTIQVFQFNWIQIQFNYSKWFEMTDALNGNQGSPCFVILKFKHFSRTFPRQMFIYYIAALSPKA